MSQTSRPVFEGKALKAELDLTPEQINDAADELAVHGFVRLIKFMGTAPFQFGHMKPTYALYYTFHDYLTDEFDPTQDVRQVAAVVASHGQANGGLLSKELDLSPTRINFAVSYLADYGIAKAHKSMGTAPFNFAFVMATAATRRFVREG